MPFSFFRTYVPSLDTDDPVVLSYEGATPRIIAALSEYPGKQMIHSGDWWRPLTKKRTLENVLECQSKLYNSKTVGAHSKNVEPQGIDRWNLPRSERFRALQISLDNANWALEHADRPMKVYCILSAAREDDAHEFFSRAVDCGHTAFGGGYSRIVASPKYRREGTVRILRTIRAARDAIGDYPLHITGISSLRLLAFLAWCGATSCDGSTPIISASAYGTVYEENGRAIQISKIKSWKCECSACAGRETILEDFKRDYDLRRMHNLNMWWRELARINEALSQNGIEEYLKERVGEFGKGYIRLREELLV